MEMLNNFSTILALNDDLWKILINVFSNWIVNYGWAIILFTVCLKLIMSPLDILQRRSSQKQSKMMSVMQPEMAKLQEKYGNDRERLNQEQAKLYKKHNVNMGGMCFSMLLTMGISLVVFFTLYSSLRAYGTEKLYTTYQHLDNVYLTAEAEAIAQGKTEEETKQYILDEVGNAYQVQQQENSWLWIKNVWKSDTNTPQYVDFESYANYFGIQNTEDEKLRDDAKARHDVITGEVIEKINPGQNGYYILIVLAAVVSFLTQFLSTKMMAQKGQKLNMMNMVMFAIIPITMVILAMTSNAVFTLYVIANSIMTALISTIIALVMKSKNKGNKDGDIIVSKKRVDVVEYSRNYKK